MDKIQYALLIIITKETDNPIKTKVIEVKSGTMSG